MMTSKRKALGFFFFLLLAIAPSATGQQIIQMTSGWCSPTIANVVGDVVIKCIGIPPPVHKKLTEELKKLKATHQLEVQQLVAKADDWVSRYNELNERLRQITEHPAEIGEIRRLISDGRFEAALARLDAGIKHYDKHLETLAELHYLRANVAALTFDMVAADRDLRLAYQYQPTNSTYLLAYAESLIEEGRFAQAELLLRQALPSLRDRAHNGSIKDIIPLADALGKLGAVLIQSNRLSEIDAVSKESLELVDRLVLIKKANKGTIEEPGGRTDDELMGKLTFSLGRNNFIAGRLDYAENMLQTSFGLNLDLCTKNALFCGLAAFSASLSGEIDRARGNYARAIQRYDLALHALKMYEGTITPLPGRAKVLLFSVQALLQQKRLDEAEKNCRAILDTWHEGEYLGHQHRVALAYAYNKLGEFAMSRGRLAEGEASFYRALSLTKDHSGLGIDNEAALASVSIALVFLSNGQSVRALPYAMSAIETLRAQWDMTPKGNETNYARGLFALGLSQILTGDGKTGCATLGLIDTVEPGGVWDRQSKNTRASCR